MPSTLLQRVLSGDTEAIVAFAMPESCVVVDWRDRLPEILDSVAELLPPDYLRVVSEDQASMVVQVAGREPQTLSWEPKTKQEQLLLVVNRLLAPAYEMRSFRPVNGDAYALYLAPSSLWRSIEASHPEATERYFLSMERLAAFWGKSYFTRLFSKP